MRLLAELVPNLLNIEGRQKIEQAHRVTGQRDRPRPILADRDQQTGTRCCEQREIKASWENTTIMLFPDFSRATQMKRDKFRDRKKKLHERG